MTQEYRQQIAVLITLSLKYELDQCGRGLARAQKAIRRHCERGMHGKRLVSLIAVTNETPSEMADRLRSEFGLIDEIENFWVMRAPHPDHVAGRDHPFIDPMISGIRKAWVVAWKINKPDDMREAQRRNISLEQRRKYR